MKGERERSLHGHWARAASAHGRSLTFFHWVLPGSASRQERRALMCRAAALSHAPGSKAARGPGGHGCPAPPIEEPERALLFSLAAWYVGQEDVGGEPRRLPGDARQLTYHAWTPTPPGRYMPVSPPPMPRHFQPLPGGTCQSAHLPCLGTSTPPTWHCWEMSASPTPPRLAHLPSLPLATLWHATCLVQPAVAHDLSSGQP